MQEGAAEYVVVAFERAGAETLVAAAEVGLEGAPDDTVDAGMQALETLRRTLAGDEEEEAAIIRRGMVALDDLLGDQPEPPRGAPFGGGLISKADHAALWRLLQLLHGQEVRQHGDNSQHDDST